MESRPTHQALTNISTITTTTTTKTTCVAATDDIRVCLIPEVSYYRLEENMLGFPDSETNTLQDGGDSNSLGLHLLHPEADIRYNG